MSYENYTVFLERYKKEIFTKILLNKMKENIKTGLNSVSV